MKFKKRNITVPLVAVWALFVGGGVGYTQDPEPECFVATNMYAPCAGFKEYSCPSGCTPVLTGVERSNCGGPTHSGHCCQWLEQTLQCTGVECANCPAEQKPVEYTLARQYWNCEPYGGGTDHVCQPPDNQP
jgi:hypothetical protein